ncbi:Uncharacterised protein family (UPF0236) [Thermanaeromonas toyohensis ToBE]|uniref:Uncharacterized protein family (UPF0236) n=1 Tax=Thermanaeromonas toyohensis ToBE TaxID=698762 RepID=A0A1W1VRD2_9FIRM|nr:ISLre2 family transposase [Thermanaeromonas toyohensis]SMB95932.1 Uncharacterised protein family (UPF0236) [Thermanaeromonas toyohensis ToBE]
MIDIRQIVGGVLLFASGLEKLIGECKDFYELEKGIHELTQKVCSQMLTWALEQIDTRLMNERDRSLWEVVGFRAKTALSTFGEFIYRRRLYRNKETGETKFFLDEVLGWPSRAKVTPRLKELFLKLGSELSFGRAAEILGYLAPGVSAMKVWQALQEVGEALKQEGEEKRAIVFENGEVPGGEEVAPELYIEADGVIIRLQREKEKRGEIKHIVAYEGKEEVRRGRFSLKNKLVISSLRDGEGAWEESYALIGEKWDLSQTKKIYIGGDGAEWPKQGVEYFPGAEYRLDPYHLSKHLTEALWHDEETFSKVGLAISQGNWEETRRVLEEAEKKSRGDRKKRITKLLQYLKENWAGVINSPGAQRLGAIEGQIQHNIARRTKRLGARWTTSGADRMARVLAAKANGELEQYIWRWPVEQQKLKEIVKAKAKEVDRPKVEDIEKWLRVSLPALRGPYADRIWVKHVLRELTRPSLWALVG